MVHRHQGSGRRPSSSNVYRAAASSIHKDSPSNDQQQNLRPNSSFNSSSHASCSSNTRLTPDISHFCHFESDHIQPSFTSNNAGERLQQTSSIDYLLIVHSFHFRQRFRTQLLQKKPHTPTTFSHKFHLKLRIYRLQNRLRNKLPCAISLTGRSKEMNMEVSRFPKMVKRYYLQEC